MRYFTIKPRTGSAAVLELYLSETARKRPCVVICPGGAYVFCGDRDSEPNALAYLGEGYQACVLRYSVRPSAEYPPLYDEPMRDVAAAIRCLRAHADTWGIDPSKIILMGVSAGGHAAACAEVFWDDERRIPGGRDGLGRPNAMILAYPVITGGEYASHNSIGNLTGKEACSRENRNYSVEDHVRPDTCPTFLWQPAGDKTVPVQNSLLMAKSLQRNHVPFELHLYTTGFHGIGLANGEVGSSMPHVATWFPLSLRWLASIGLAAF